MLGISERLQAKKWGAGPKCLGTSWLPGAMQIHLGLLQSREWSHWPPGPPTHPPCLQLHSPTLFFTEIQTHQSYQLPRKPCSELTSLVKGTKGTESYALHFNVWLTFLGNAEPPKMLWWALGVQGGTQLSVCLPHGIPGGWVGMEQASSTTKKKKRRQQQIISGCGAKVFRWVSVIKKWISQLRKVEQGVIAVVQDSLPMNRPQSGGWGQGTLPPASLAGVVSAKYHSFWGRRVRGDHVCLWQLPKSCLLAFGKPKSLLFSLCFTSHASLPGSFLKNCKATMKFVYFVAHDKKCTVSEFGYRPTCPVIFLLTHCTLAAFILSFSLPSPIHFLPLFFLWKKVFDKGLKTPATLSGEGPQPPDNSSIATAVP